MQPVIQAVYSQLHKFDHFDFLLIRWKPTQIENWMVRIKIEIFLKFKWTNHSNMWIIEGKLNGKTISQLSEKFNTSKFKHFFFPPNWQDLNFSYSVCLFMVNTENIEGWICYFPFYFVHCFFFFFYWISTFRAWPITSALWPTI